MSINIAQLDMPGVSPQGLQIIELVSNDDADPRRIEQIIMQDPTLASSLIRYANSPLFRRRTQITNVPNALTLLGLKNVRSAVVMATLHSISDYGSGINNAVWNHGQAVALLCKSIATKVKPTIADDVEFIGLIHDLGALVLSSNLDEEYAALYRRAVEDGQPLETLEHSSLGIDHDQVMCHFANHLRLPDTLKDILQHIHNRTKLSALETEADYMQAIVAMAHQLLKQYSLDHMSQCEAVTETLEELKALLKLDDATIEKIVAKLPSGAFDAD